MVLYELVDLGMDSWDFYLGFGCKKFQTTNTSVSSVVLDKFPVGFLGWFLLS